MYVNGIVLDELRKIIKDSKLLQEDDRRWPEPNKVGKQELKITLDGRNYTFLLSKLGSF